MHGDTKPPPGDDEDHVKFIFSDSKENIDIEVKAREGESLLEVAHNNGVELEGACEQALACSTCHCILQDEIYDELEEPCEDELDLLDLAFGLTETSRLGC